MSIRSPGRPVGRTGAGGPADEGRGSDGRFRGRFFGPMLRWRGGRAGFNVAASPVHPLAGTSSQFQYWNSSGRPTVPRSGAARRRRGWRREAGRWARLGRASLRTVRLFGPMSRWRGGCAGFGIGASPVHPRAGTSSQFRCRTSSGRLTVPRLGGGPLREGPPPGGGSRGRKWVRWWRPEADRGAPGATVAPERRIAWRGATVADRGARGAVVVPERPIAGRAVRCWHPRCGPQGAVR